jgi:Iap family predicted aminopeptidase
VEKAPEPTTPQARITEYVRELTGEEMAGRRTGTRGEALAALYLAKHLQRLGIEPAGAEKTYFQSFPTGEITWQMMHNRMTLRHNQNAAGAQSANVLGLIPGRSEEIIVLSAHYDHLGVIENELYPGANDNASGTALVMELAAALKSERPRYTVLVAFWGGEEAGLLGSHYFTHNMTVPRRSLKAIINLDSLGNLSGKKLLGWRSGEGETCEHFISELTQAGWEITWENTMSHSSDHATFGRAGISGFTLLSPDWLKDNHTPRDVSKEVNFKMLTELMNDLKTILI